MIVFIIMIVLLSLPEVTSSLNVKAVKVTKKRKIITMGKRVDFWELVEEQYSNMGRIKRDGKQSR